MFINQAKEGLCNICLHILAKRWIKCFVIWLDPSFPLGFAGFPHTGLFHRNQDLRASLWGITVTIYKIPRSRYPGYQRVFSRVRRGPSFRRPQADTCSAKGRRHERPSREKKFWMIWYKRGCNWLGAIRRDGALVQRLFARVSF